MDIRAEIDKILNKIDQLNSKTDRILDLLETVQDFSCTTLDELVNLSESI